MQRTIVILCLLFSCSLARADWKEDVSPALLSGQGEFTFWGFDLYTAQLWTTQLPFDNAKPFALHLTYKRHISRERLVDSGMDEMQRILGDAWPKGQAPIWKQDMEQAFADVKEGDSITGVYLPGFGARFYLNDKQTIDVQDEAFAKAFFSIWLGPKTRAPKLRALLINASNGGNQ